MSTSESRDPLNCLLNKITFHATRILKEMSDEIMSTLLNFKKPKVKFYILKEHMCFVKGKGKVIPLQARCGSEGG